MRESRKPISAELVRELFDYDRENGFLLWRTLPGQYSNKVGCGRAKVGSRAGNYSSLYGSVSIEGKRYMVHRIIFTYCHGYYPENYVDHIDGNPENNRIENLREVSQSCNMRNVGLRNDNVSGVSGVNKTKDGRYRARININGKETWLGKFNSMIEAVRARHKKEVELEWEGCCSTSSAFLYLREYSSGGGMKNAENISL